MNKPKNYTVVGLTGQSGAGKTAVSHIFKECGFGIVNCDLVARQATVDGSDCNRKLAEIFPECFDKAFKLDRQKLAGIVFSDKSKLETLDGIIYPYICRMIDEEILRLSEDCKYILLDAPTLFEAGADRLCDVIVSVVAKEEIRLERVLRRDGIGKELILKRFSSQYPEEFFRNSSDYVIENNFDFEQTKQATLNTVLKIKEAYNG